MTFHSHFISCLTARGDKHVIADLSGQVEDSGALALAQWAERQGIDRSTFEWIDNCWLKVHATPPQVAVYLDSVLQPASSSALKALIDPAAAYVIEAEEF